MRNSMFLSKLHVALERSHLTECLAHVERFMSKTQVIFDLSEKWSKKINVTANVSAEDFILENILDPALAYQAFINGHFTTSLFPSPVLRDRSLADVGCGGGFVGFTWHLLNNESGRLLLIDSDRKKINFCKEVIRKLALRNCTAYCARAEDIREPLADIVVTRATWGPEETRRCCLGLARPNAVFVNFCGPKTLNHNKNNLILEYALRPNLVRYLSVSGSIQRFAR